MKTTLSVFAVFLVIAYVNGADIIQSALQLKVAKVAKKCAADHKANPEQAGVVFSQKVPSDEVERCLLECVYTRVGVVIGGEFNAASSKKLASLRYTDPKDLETANKLVDTCSKEVTKTKGEKCSLGKSIRECLFKHGEEVHFFPSVN